MPSPSRTQAMIDATVADSMTDNFQVGNQWYVDSTHAQKEDSASHGTAADTPFATLD